MTRLKMANRIRPPVEEPKYLWLDRCMHSGLMQIDVRKKRNYCHGEALLLPLFFLSRHPNYLGTNRIIQ